MCSAPAREHGLPRPEESPEDKKKATCSARRRPEAASRVPKQGFVLVQSVLRSRTARSSPSKLLRPQVSRRILTGHQSPRVALNLRPAPVSGSCVITYKKSDKVKQIRGRCESGTRAEFGSRGTG